MALETGTFIDDLVSTNPVDSTDQVSSLGDHIRLLKDTIKRTFPNVDAAINPTDTELNYLVGVTSAVQTQLGTKAAAGENADITSLTGLTTPLAVDYGGTGETTAAGAVQAALDAVSTTQGAVLYRGADDWAALDPGTAGQVLVSGGAAANPSWGSSGVAQMLYDDYTSAGTFATQVPWDTSSPGASEGTELLSVTITPVSSSSRLVIDVSVLTYSATGVPSHAVLYKDGSPIRSSYSSAEGGDYWSAHEFRHSEEAGTTDERVYTVRVGNGSGTSNWSVNTTQVGGAAAGLTKPQMTVMEVLGA